MSANPIGRPTKITPEVVSILIDCFHRGMSVREACLHAVISRDTYYSHTRKDQEFSDKMDRAQQVPTVTAKQLMVRAINEGNIGVAKWWLERKVPHEFGLNTRLVVQPELEPEPVNELDGLTDEELNNLLKELAYNEATYEQRKKYFHNPSA